MWTSTYCVQAPTACQLPALGYIGEQEPAVSASLHHDGKLPPSLCSAPLPPMTSPLTDSCDFIPPNGHLLLRTRRRSGAVLFNLYREVDYYYFFFHVSDDETASEKLKNSPQLVCDCMGSRPGPRAPQPVHFCHAVQPGALYGHGSAPLVTHEATTVTCNKPCGMTQDVKTLKTHLPPPCNSFVENCMLFSRQKPIFCIFSLSGLLPVSLLWESSFMSFSFSLSPTILGPMAL